MDILIKNSAERLGHIDRWKPFHAVLLCRQLHAKSHNSFIHLL